MKIRNMAFHEQSTDDIPDGSLKLGQYSTIMSLHVRSSGMECRIGQPDKHIICRKGRFSNHSGKISNLLQLSIFKLVREERCCKPCGRHDNS
uniref:NBS-LRR n=1 Tax=Oryza grandiglumis TaxID=29690 RepID=K4Q5V3_ORYGR|nr:NBS-LRR [Oryza grandiglumis]